MMMMRTYGDVSFESRLCFVREALPCLSAGRVSGHAVGDGGVGGCHDVLLAFSFFF